MERGPIEAMLEQWERERPDLDTSSLGIVARISRLSHALGESAADVLKQFGMSDVEFQLLAAVRRAGPDGRPSPRDLLGPLMVTSGGLTNRIDRLESAGHLVRVPNPKDRRGVCLQLTPQGREVVDRVTTAYLANQSQLLASALTLDERETLAHLLRKLLTSVTPRHHPASSDTPPIAPPTPS